MSGLILPPSHAIHGKPPKYACTICEAVFTEDEQRQFERHVLSHPPEEIKPHSPFMQAPGIFDPHHESGDVDWQRWIDEHNESDPNGWRRWMRTGLDK